MALGFAILGTGRFAAGRIMPALIRAQGCKPVAVVSRDRGRAEAFAADHGVPRAYDTLAAALADPRVDAVWIATPNDRHRPEAEAAARARKHVLCEKPLATTVTDARAIVEVCQRAGVALGTGFHLRHHPLLREARRLAGEGAIGPVQLAAVEWSLDTPINDSAPWRRDFAVSGGGIGTGTGIHGIDLLRYVLEDEVAAVSAFTDATTSPAAPVETQIVADLRFRRGTLATLRAMRPVYAPANSLELLGSRASLVARGAIEEAARGRLEVQGADARLAGVPAGTDLYALQAQAFAEAVYRGDEPNASGWDGLALVIILTALYESARTGRTVEIATAR